jgi:alanine dehydrogenase
MTVVLNDDDVSRLLSMEQCIGALEEAYTDAGRGTAVNAPRRDTFLASSRPGRYYSFKTIEGGLERLGVVAQRINSDLITYPLIDGVPRRVKVPAAPGGRYVGLVFLYSTETLELLAIMTDGHLQRMRVAGTTGVAAKHLARPDARTLALYGSGWQAEAAAWALAAVRPLSSIRIYSPTPANRTALAQRLTERLSLEAIPVAKPEEAARGADIVATATNAQRAVASGAWVESGMHLTSITTVELDDAAWQRADRIIASATPDHYMNYRTANPGLDRVLSDRDLRTNVEDRRFDQFAGKMSLLSEMLIGRASGRTHPEEVTLMDKTWGLGIEFASVAKVVYDRAKAAGAGHEIPTEWFTQTSHP